TRQENLDFFVLFSSSTSLHSAPGQSDYTAANSFLDSYAEYRNRQGRNTLVINWAGWKEVGMLSDSRTMLNYGALTTEEALNSLLIVLGRKINSVMIGALTYVEGALSSHERLPLELSTEVKTEVSYNIMILGKTLERNLSQEAKLKGGSGEYKELEKNLAQIWSEVLGIGEIDINDHFFDLGGDSLRIAEVHSLLEKKYPGKFSVAELFAYPTITKLVQHIENQNLPLQIEKQDKESSLNQDIAIIGMAARTSRASDVEEFWQNLSDGIDCIREAPISRKQDMDDYLRFKGVDEKLRRYQVAAYLEEIDKFDYEFFRISPREAKLMDPNQRVLLETIYHSLENAGYGGTRLSGTKTGLYVGFFPLGSKYYDLIAELEPSALSEAMVNNMDPTIASRVSYYLNLNGPSMLVNTACSSSLVAVHLACQAIRSGDCDQAIVGSVKISLLSLLNNPKVGIESKDGHTRTFDNNSDGTGLGEGVASIVLKPLSAALRDG
ncbi:MAG: beta-ketoacyl synthase N-terminal-like domain-containing protein, partial [Candidatus Magasanikbacteria bacterium]|nr:beta-ketoacyl synthase N-terminal-like domain-containing protein [Candidatus Magasanikbacteria bacterium]